MSYLKDFIFYWLAVFIYIFSLSVIFKKEIKAFIKYLPLALVSQLIFWLIALGVDNRNPFVAGSRDIYGIYAQGYFFIAISIFIFYIIAKIKTKDFFKDKGELAIHLPLFLLLFYLIYTLFLHGKYMMLFLFSSAIAVFYFFGSRHINMYRIRKLSDYLFAKENLLVLAIFLIAFIARYFFSLRLLSLPGDDYLRACDDGLTYSSLAAHWARGKLSCTDVLYWGGYGYWVLLGVLYNIFGINNYLVVTLIQSLLGALVSVFVFYIGKNIFNRYVALMAAILTTLDINLTFLSATLNMEALFIPMVFLGLLMIILYFKKKEGRKLLHLGFIGIFFGFTNIVRGEIIIFPFIIGILAFIFLRRNIETRGIFTALAVFYLGFLMPLLLHATRNYINCNKFTIATAQANISFINSYGAEENGILANMGFNPFADHRRALSVFLAKPREVVTLLVKGYFKRSILFLTFPNFGIFDPITIVNPGRGYPYHYSIYLLGYGAILLFSGIILAFANKEKKFEKYIILSYILYTTSIYAIIMATNARHRAVLNPLFYLLVAYGFFRFIRRISQKTT